MADDFSRTRPTVLSKEVLANIDRVLASIRSYLGMDVAFLSEFLGENRIFHNVDSVRVGGPIRVGGVIPMAAGYCRHVVEGRLPELIPNTNAVALARTIPETRSIPIGAHLSVPVKLEDGRTFGTFCAFSYRPNPKLNQRDLELVRTFSRLVAHQIDVEAAAQRHLQEKGARIRSAVDRGDPQVVFQPIVRLGDLAVVGVEALSRFAADPKRSPNEWFADAEEAGLGEGLELVAIRTAIAQSRDLPSDLSISVNVSPGTLVRGRVLSHALHGIEPQRVIIEITEHKPVEDYAALLSALVPLRDAGVRIAIDDAGAGYSSFRHVLNLRPNYIKLDVSITRDLGRDRTRAALAAALVEFGNRTGTKLVAEGVETAEDLAALRQLGVEKGQGYFLAKPVPATAFGAALASVQRLSVQTPLSGVA
jgi:EAL domain-containing protein (putative c-di-GMP-specific phosphodiesterase class I)